MSWIDQQNSELLKDYVMRTDALLMTSMPDGKILWANTSFLHFIKYSLSELEQKTWPDISYDDETLKADFEEVRKLMTGEIPHYNIQKYYIPKNDRPKLVNLHVKRYPASGDFGCCLVTVTPLNDMDTAIYEATMQQIKDVMSPFSEFLEIMKKDRERRSNIELMFVGLARMIKENPRTSSIVSIVIAALIIGGDRLFNIINKILELFGVGA